MGWEKFISRMNADDESPLEEELIACDRNHSWSICTNIHSNTLCGQASAHFGAPAEFEELE
jgi:hypothetical protein